MQCRPISSVPRGLTLAAHLAQAELEQILQLTGRRTLDGSDGLTQYRTLMDNAAQTAAGLGLVLGAPLTAVQIASLDSDIVWLVEQEIDGQTVLVPVVYLSRATAERLRADGALIAADDLDIRSATTVRNDGTMSASQGMWLSADTLINDGTMDAGQRLAIATTGDTLNRGRLSGGAVTVNAGRDVRNEGAIVARDGDALVQAGRDFVQTSTGSLASTGSTVVTAGRDLSLEATTVTAGEHLVLGAGRDLSVTAKAGVQTVVDGYTVSTRETLQASDLQAGGNLVLQAGRDATLQAAQLQAGDAVAIAAGRDLSLSTLTTTDTTLTDINGRRFKQRTETLDETVHGTTVQAGGDIAMTAGRDATLTAAQVVSEEGGIAIAAGRDLTLAAAEETHRFEQDTVRKKSGFLSSKTTTTHDESTATYAVGTTLSGETVDLAAGNDLTLQAATVAGTGDVRLVAGNDITIETAENTTTESHSSHTKRSGLFGTGGVGFTIGKQTRESTADITDLTHTGSLIGSTDGRVDIVAGGDVAIAGSDVLSKAGIGITGENVAITAVENSLSVVEAQKFRQAGINVSLKGGVVDTATAVYGATRRGNEVEDDRLKALYAAKAGQTLFSNGQAGLNSFGDTGQQISDLASTGKETQATGNGGLSLRIGIGASKSDSKQTYTETTVTGSRIASEGDVAIVARSGDLSVTGSQIEGDNVALAAAQDLILQSAQESHAMDARDHASSGEIGFTFGSEAGIGVYVSASVAKGQGEGSGTSNVETTVQAGDTLTLISGRDTTLEGAQAIGETVIANVGRNLTMTSQHDRNDYEREDMSAGIDVAVGMGGGSASGYYNQSDIDSAYTSVNEQTGIQAGAGGFDIEVGGHTELTGAAIASTADPSLNRLSTESLSVSDLANRAEYDASSFGVSGGTSGSSDSPWSGSASPSLGIRQSDSEASTTRSGISDGTLEIRDGGESALAHLDRNFNELQHSGLGEIFDEQKVAERMEMGQVAGEVAFTAAGDLAGALRERAEGDLERARESGDQAAIDAVQAQVSAWSEGGTGKTILHGLAGAGMAALGGGDVLLGMSGAVANQVAADAMQSYLVGQGYVPGTPEFDSLLQLGSLAVGAATGAGSGAATALSATQNNYLNHAERMEYLEAALQCSQTGESCGRAAELEVLSESRNEVLKSACTDRYSGGCQAALQEAITTAADHQVNQSEYLAWMVKNGTTLLAADNPLRGDDTLVPNVVTHTTTADLIWKIDCASAGSDCSRLGSLGALQQGDAQSAMRHEAMRSMLRGAGRVGGVSGRAVDTVVGLYDLLKLASPVTRLGETWPAIEYVNEHGLQAYLDVEQEKSKAIWTGLWDGGKTYLSDVGSAISNNLQGGSQWDIYDVYMQGNTEGKVGFDVLGLFVGATELNIASKAALADRMVAKAFREAREEAAESARVANNFYRDGAAFEFPKEIQTTSGVVITANPDKTTTVLGAYIQDTGKIINAELGLPKSMVVDGSVQPGAFNLLNTPDSLYTALGSERFWSMVNKPWLDAAIKRGDDIVLATRPDFSLGGNVYRPDGEFTGFGREINYLKERGYVYDPGSGKMVRS